MFVVVLLVFRQNINVTGQGKPGKIMNRMYECKKNWYIYIYIHVYYIYIHIYIYIYKFFKNQI